jgi:hypothetical protein
MEEVIMRIFHILPIPALSLLACACAGSDPSSGADPQAGESSAALGAEARSPVFSPAARPFGRDMATWSERQWRWLMAIPAGENPQLDPTGAHCGVNQEGPVWFLTNVNGDPGERTVTRACTLPEGKAVFMPMSDTLNDYPCPDPNFRPAPGQSLYDFLRTGAEKIVNQVDGLWLAVDGQSIASPTAYRYTSPRLFHFAGDPSNAAQLDPCITGSRQPAVSDGFFVMLRPLDAGSHSLSVRATDTAGTDVTVVWNLTVTRR